MPARKSKTKQAKKAAPKNVVVNTPKEKEIETPLPQKEKFNGKKVVALLKKPQVYAPIAILLAILVVFLVKSFFIVAVVNGQFIYRPSLDASLEQQYGKQQLSTLVTQMLVQQYAQSKGITVSQSDIDTQTKQISDQLAAQGQTLNQALASRGMTMSDFVQQVKLQDLLQKILAKQIAVSPSDVQKYIAQNKSSLPAGQSPAQLNAEVAQQLQQQKLSTQAQTFIQKLQAQAHITYFVNF